MNVSLLTFVIYNSEPDMEKLEISYYANSNHYEHDQETFLMWCFDCLKSEDKNLNSFSKELIMLFLWNGGNLIKDDISFISSRPHVACRQIAKEKERKRGRIDIIAVFQIKKEVFALVIEHKALSSSGNDFKLYKEIAQDYCNKLNIKNIRYCFLDPFYTKADKEIDKEFKIVRYGYCSLLRDYADSIPVVNDYYCSYFCDFNSPIVSLSRKLKNRFCYICSGNEYKTSGTKEISIEYGQNEIIIRILQWDTGTYTLKTSKKRVLDELISKQIMTYFGDYPKRCVFIDKNKLETISDLKDICERSLKCLKNMEVLK